MPTRSGDKRREGGSPSRDLKGKDAPTSNPIIEQLLKDVKEQVVEVTLEDDQRVAYEVRFVDD